MSTSPIVVPVNQDAVTIKADATFALTSGTLQAFSNLDDLSLPVPVANPYATYEPDFWLLDGSMKFLPASPHVGLMTSTMSNDNEGGGGDFDTSPVLTITFGSAHSTNGLTLYFSEYTGDYFTQIAVFFYDASNALIDSTLFFPTGTTFFTNEAIANFKKIEIRFDSTNHPYRYARLTGIDFDSLTIFQGDAIRAAHLVEQINPLAVELPINELDLTLFSSDGDFSIVDPQGFYANLQYKEPLDVYEDLNGEIIYIGRFYLDKWESISENLAELDASDAIGLLDTLPFYDPRQGTGAMDADDFLDNIMDGTTIPYSVDASLASESVSGWVPAVSKREAIQQLCFRIGGYATCARSDGINILPFELAEDLVAYDYTITAAQKGINKPVKLRPLVTGVELLSHEYVDVTEDKEIFSGTLPTGNHMVFADFPSSATTVIDGTGTHTFLDYGLNWLLFTVTVAGTFVAKSQEYANIHTLVHRVNNGSLPAGTPENIIKIDDATLVRRAQGDSTAQRVYDYFQQRYVQQTKLFAHQIAVGNSVLIDTQSGRQIAGIVEKMSTDLANGFVSDVDIVGVVVPL